MRVSMKPKIFVIAYCLIASFCYSQNCSVNTSEAILTTFLNSLRLIAHQAGNSQRKTVVTGLINQAQLVLEKKQQLIDACAKYSTSFEDTDWSTVETRLKATNSTLQAFEDDLTDAIETYPQDAITPELINLQGTVVSRKLKTLCDLSSKPATQQAQADYRKRVNELKDEKEQIKSAVKELNDLVHSIANGNAA